jgi:hypothetical protein
LQAKYQAALQARIAQLGTRTQLPKAEGAGAAPEQLPIRQEKEKNRTKFWVSSSFLQNEPSIVSRLCGLTSIY